MMHSMGYHLLHAPVRRVVKSASRPMSDLSHELGQKHVLVASGEKASPGNINELPRLRVD